MFASSNHTDRISDSSVTPSPISWPTPCLPDLTMPLAGDWAEALHEAFVRQAKRVPHKTAIVGHAIALSYAELDRLSNRLAHYLCAHDCSGKVVAIYAERSPTIVWAILGVLKAGAAFLILNATYPAARLAEYCRQARPSALLQLAEAGPLPDLLSPVVGPVRLTLSPSPATACQSLNAYSEAAPSLTVDPKQLAYLMFTSGSTGRPKGIMGHHEPPTHFVAWHRNTFGFTEAERFSMVSGLGHDPLLRDIFTPLSLGATLYIPTADDLLPGQLSTWMREQQITVAHLTPPMGQLIGADETVLVRLRYLFFGGDKLPTSLVEKLYQLAPHVTCVNFYGASETPQAMGYFVVPRSGISGAVVPIGRGIQDVQLFVLTDDLQLAGSGEVGEIAIRTPYLALGYLGEQSATSQKFIANPFTGQEGDRIYLTGDLGRYLPDNNVEILGRRDQQVQLRGHRIELSEIEAALNAHPAVEQSVIVLRKQATGNYLVAYVVTSASIPEWRSYLSAQLPDYMLPNALLPVERFPLTPNGKIDLSALPELTLSAESFVAPHTPTEARLAAIWREVLGAEAVGVTDDFLALGGHSLLAMQLIVRVREAFGIELPLHWLFDSCTIATLASHIEKAQNQSTIEPHALSSITSAIQRREHPLSFSQQRFWLLAQMQPEGQRGLYNIYRMARLIGPLDVGALSQSFSLLVRRHESLRTSFEPVDGQPTQLIHPPFAVSVPVVDLTSMGREEQASAIQRLASEIAQYPFDLVDAPLWRVQLVQLDTHEYLLFFVIHHIVSDGSSMRLLVSDLSVLYNALLRGESTPLPPLEIQYIDYTDWQRTAYQSETLSRQLAYWKAQLAGPWPILDLPRDYPVPTGQTFTTQTLSLTFSDSLR